MKTVVALILPFILLVGVSGCYLGDRPTLSRTVTLNFYQPQSVNTVDLSLTNLEVQEALKIVDDVLGANGFVRETSPDMAGVPGFVMDYRLIESSGLRSSKCPDIYFGDGHLSVRIEELGNRTTHPSALTDKICESLKVEFKRRFGSKSVKIIE